MFRPFRLVRRMSRLFLLTFVSVLSLSTVAQAVDPTFDCGAPYANTTLCDYAIYGSCSDTCALSTGDIISNCVKQFTDALDVCNLIANTYDRVACGINASCQGQICQVGYLDAYCSCNGECGISAGSAPPTTTIADIILSGSKAFTLPPTGSPLQSAPNNAPSPSTPTNMGTSASILEATTSHYLSLHVFKLVSLVILPIII
jgi:hypothetical protein